MIQQKCWSDTALYPVEQAIVRAAGHRDGGRVQTVGERGEFFDILDVMAGSEAHQYLMDHFKSPKPLVTVTVMPIGTPGLAHPDNGHALSAFISVEAGSLVTTYDSLTAASLANDPLPPVHINSFYPPMRTMQYPIVPLKYMVSRIQKPGPGFDTINGIASGKYVASVVLCYIGTHIQIHVKRV